MKKIKHFIYLNRQKKKTLVLDTTYSDKEHKKIINDLIGKPYSFLESLRMGGVGSKRMIIDEVSPNLQPLLNTVADVNYGNIEMRSDGILVYINKGHHRTYG